MKDAFKTGFGLTMGLFCGSMVVGFINDMVKELRKADNENSNSTEEIKEEVAQ